jgi:8-oxo-dGTP pyrophosphatase MutT (NUDIX family)
MRRNSDNAIQKIMVDLQSRFLMNVPDDVAGSMNRIMVEVQKAYWMYTDNKKLSSIGGPMDFATFSEHFFKSSQSLKSHAGRIKCILTNFNNYLKTVPVYGCFIMDTAMSHVLMVRQGSSWLFPRGKRDEGESEVDSAIREVREEVKLDVSSLISPKEYIEAKFNGKSIRLYVVVGVDLSFAPKALASTEIHECKWKPVDSMPANYHTESFARLLYAWAERRSQAPTEHEAAHAHVRVPTADGTLPLWRVYLEHCPRLAERLRPLMETGGGSKAGRAVPRPEVGTGWSTRDMFHANEALLDRDRLAASAARTTVLDFCDPVMPTLQPHARTQPRKPAQRDGRRDGSRDAARDAAVPLVCLPPPPASASAIRRPPPIDSLLAPPPTLPTHTTHTHARVPVPLDAVFGRPPPARDPAPGPGPGVPVDIRDLMAHHAQATAGTPPAPAYVPAPPLETGASEAATPPQPAVLPAPPAVLPAPAAGESPLTRPLQSPARPANAKMSRVKALLRK